MGCFSSSQIKDVGCQNAVLASKGTALVVFLLTSIAKYHSAWMWLQVYLPCVRLVLQPTRVCLRIPGVAHCGKAGSSPTQRCKLLGEGRMSYMALMVNLHSPGTPICFLLVAHFLYHWRSFLGVVAPEPWPPLPTTITLFPLSKSSHCLNDQTFDRLT